MINIMKFYAEEYLLTLKSEGFIKLMQHLVMIYE